VHPCKGIRGNCSEIFLAVMKRISVFVASWLFLVDNGEIGMEKLKAFEKLSVPSLWLGPAASTNVRTSKITSFGTRFGEGGGEIEGYVWVCHSR